MPRPVRPRPAAWLQAAALAGATLAAAAAQTAAAAAPGARAATQATNQAAAPVAASRHVSHRRSARAAVRNDQAPDLVTYGGRADVKRFAAELAEQRDLDRAWVEQTLAEARYVPAVARLIMPPPAGSAKNWAAYRARFVEPERLRAGLAFWQANARWLDEAEARFGVPAAVVVGIIGVETLYGRQTGGFRVLDALATLSFDFPSGRKDRSAFFRDELGQFLALAQREALAPAALKGSYAGAIGPGQFMPSSILKYGLDFDGDGHGYMSGSAADVIGSVAHYLAEHGWQRGQATHFAVQAPVDTADRAALLAPDILPSFTPAQLAERGAVLDDAGRRHDGPLALVELQNGEAAPSYIAGTQNFYAVTRYNWSAYYALAVIELGNAVAALRQAGR